MVSRNMRMAVGVLCCWISSVLAFAQPPAESPTAAGLYPQDGSSYVYNNGTSFEDELELSPVFRFQADWVFLKRNNDINDIPAISGPDSYGLSDAEFDYKSGYRLNLGLMNDDFELEATFMELDGLSASRFGRLANAIVFDGPAAFAAAIPGARATVGATPNFLTSSTLFSPINAAALDPADETDGLGVLNELEYIQPGAAYFACYTTDVQDFEVNFKGRRQSQRMFRFGVGYRNLQYREIGQVGFRGTFDTVDAIDDFDVPTNPDNLPNNGLSDGSLIRQGLTLDSGDADGFSENDVLLPGDNDVLLFASNTHASNRLNGVQGTLDAMFLESDYFQIGGYAKAGVYHNDVSGSLSETYTDIVNDGSTYSRQFSDAKDRIAFVGNLGVTGTVILRENFRFFAAYEMMFLSGVALAPDQQQGLTTDIAGNMYLDLQTNGSAVLYGGRLGFEILLP